MPKERHTDSLTEEIERNFYTRCPPEQRPKEFRSQGLEDIRHPIPQPKQHRGSGTNTLADDDVVDEKPRLSTEKTVDEAVPPTENASTESKRKYDSSLAKALHKTFFWHWWISGALKLFAGMSLWFGKPVNLLTCLCRHSQDDHSSTQQGPSHMAD